jgi:hypothetical protein
VLALELFSDLETDRGCVVASQLGDLRRVTLRVFSQQPQTTPEPIEVTVAGPLLPGPVGSRLAVFDYNRELDRLFPAATPNKDGSFPDYPATDLRFHQLAAYAVAARAIELVEFELGRTIGWGFDGNRLIVLPHAGYMANAFYSEETQSLELYSFRLDKRRVYHTCLVHDIVAHETGHALLDAIRDRYTEGLHPETHALHEAIGDIAAVFASLSHEVNRVQLLRDCGQDLRRANAVAAIAEEFEEGAVGRIALRTLTGDQAMDFEGVTEPHDLSLKLTRAVWDALARMYDRVLQAGHEPEEALRLSRTALQRMVVRGFDYLPPADATFMDFATAMLRADVHKNPEDEHGFRASVADAMVAGGIAPTAQVLLGEPAHEGPWPVPAAWPRLTPTEVYLFLDGHRERLALSRQPAYRDFVVREFHITNKPPDHTEIDEVIVVYEYPVDVALKPPGGQDEMWIPVWGGGTLVFDRDGNLLHHAEKPVTRDRVREAMAFVLSEADSGAVTVLGPGDDDRLRRNAARRPFAIELSGDTITFRTNPAARCRSGAREALL